MANGVATNGDSCIPYWLKMVMVFIDRVGFPILAFLLMFWMSYGSINKVDASLQQVTKALDEWRISTLEFRKLMFDKQEDVIDCQRDILNILRK